MSSSLIEFRVPYNASDQSIPPRPTLKDLRSLTPLQGHLTFVHVANLFHLFDYSQQAAAAKSLASLLSPEPGSTIFGTHRTELNLGSYSNFRGELIHCHTPETWTRLWDGEVFQKGTVRVITEMKVFDAKDLAGLGLGIDKLHIMVWSVTRL